MAIEEFLVWYREKEDAEYRIKPEDIYKTIWSCRDFEISHLWQRSVFLAVFLLAVAGAYGKIVMEMYFPSNENSVTWQQHCIASCVCWIEIIFSILWVMMAKGSKY